MSDTSDRYATWDAAYVLGALAPGERREYEEHLAGCASCEAAVGELAGLPGLLAQLPADDALALVPAAAPAEVLDERPPADCLEPDRVRARPASLRRGRLVAAAAAGVAAGVLLVLVGIAYAVGLVPFESGDPRRLAFASVGPTGLTAVVDVLPVGDGTDINVECVDGQPGSGRTYTSYRIYVVDRSGRAELVKEWPAKPNKTMRPRAHTDLRLRQIERVEIRDSATDNPRLRAYLR